MSKSSSSATVDRRFVTLPNVTRADYMRKLTAIGLAYHSNTPTILWGPPGQGKSSVLKALAGHMKVPFWLLVLAQSAPEDVGGTPVVIPPDAPGGIPMVRRAPMGWLAEAHAAEEGLVLFDEISNASGALRAAALSGFDDNAQFGDTKLPHGVRRMLAANPPDMAEDGWPLGGPFSNRIFHVRDWALPAEVFAAGLRTGVWPTVPTLEFRNLEKSLAWAADVVAAFVTASEVRLTRLPVDDDERQYPWASPRSWTICARMLGYARAARIIDPPTETNPHPEPRRIDSDTRFLIYSGCVGDAVATGFKDFVDNLSLPDPRAILEDPTSWQPPSRFDICQDAIDSVLGVLVAEPTAERWINAGRFLGRIIEVGHAEAAAAKMSVWYPIGLRLGVAHLLPNELGPGSRFAELLDQTRATRMPVATS